MLFSVLTRKNDIPRHNFHPLRSRSCWEEAELSWRLPQGQAPTTQLAFRLLRLPRQWGTRPTDCILCRWPLPLGHRDGDGERCMAISRPGQWAAMGRASEPCRTEPPACSLGPSNSTTGMRLSEWEGPGETARIHLSPHCPPEDHQPSRHWLNGPRKVTHGQLLARERGAPWPRPVAEQDPTSASAGASAWWQGARHRPRDACEGLSVAALQPRIPQSDTEKPHCQQKPEGKGHTLYRGAKWQQASSEGPCRKTTEQHL